MRILLLYPAFPSSFWSFEKTIELIGRKAMLPPLGLITVAALCPPDWEFRLVDCNVRRPTEADWDWADMVMLSAMIVQKQDLLACIREAKQRGKRVVVGGPYPTALPQECAEADFLVLDEAEITLAPFLEALARGETSGTFRAGGIKPDVTSTPMPRFELLDLDAYAEMSVQFSRGCPFLCEFCDIIVLYGRKPRTKTPQQMLAELQRLYDLGWRRSVFVVDDNFIGNKKNVKALLAELRPWMEEHDYPFSLGTEASVDLAHDQDLLDGMVACNFRAVFLGIETPDTESLTLTRKTQNNRDPLAESVRRITRSGLRIMAGFIIGFDNEKPGAGQRIVDFVEDNSIPTATFSLLQALPDTGLTKRLEQEGRMLANQADLNQTTLMNFVPTRPIEQIAQEYVDGFWALYDPVKFLDRVYRHYLLMKDANYPRRARVGRKRMNLLHLRALLLILWRQGVVRSSRWRFWKRLYQIYRIYPRGVGSFISTCAQAEHFLDYRRRVRSDIRRQVQALREHPAPQVMPRPTATAAAAAADPHDDPRRLKVLGSSA
jgi:radical SAM superfamily enzyme YgiQ (UPF0313 family)